MLRKIRIYVLLLMIDKAPPLYGWSEVFLQI